MFENASGINIPYTIAPRRAGDIDKCYAKTDYAKELLGWSAQKSLDEMCKDSWRFAKKNM